MTSEDIFPPFNVTSGPLVPGGADDKEAQDDSQADVVPLAPGLGIGLGQGFEAPEETDNADTQRAK